MRRLTLSELADVTAPLGVVANGPEGDAWRLVLPLGVDLITGAVAIGVVFDYECSPS